MKRRRNRVQKFVEDLFARRFDINGEKQVTMREFVDDLAIFPESEAMTGVELSDTGGLEIGESLTIRSMKIKRIS